MLPEKYRLNIPSFRNNRKYPTRKFTTHLFTYMIKKTESLNPAKFALVIPKKLDKRSTHRNRTKRILVEALLSLIPLVKSGYEVLVYAQKILKDEKPADLYPLLKNDLQKIDLFKQ